MTAKSGGDEVFVEVQPGTADSPAAEPFLVGKTGAGKTPVADVLRAQGIPYEETDTGLVIHRNEVRP